MTETRDITLDTPLVTNPDLVLREEGTEGAILFDPDSGEVRILNPTATSVWKHLQKVRTLREVIAALSREYEGVDSESEEEVLALVRELMRLGALDEAQEPGE
jgi:hypothetical protein